MCDQTQEMAKNEGSRVDGHFGQIIWNFTSL